ncbi:MAG: tetratricopeptide repeat protein, partial [Bacteroidia bacterium]
MHAQSVNIDSLKKIVQQEKKDSSYLKALYLIAQDAGYRNTDEGEKLAIEAVKFAQQLKWKKGLASSLMVLGSIYDEAGKYNEALTQYEQALQIRKELNDK